MFISPVLSFVICALSATPSFADGDRCEVTITDLNRLQKYMQGEWASDEAPSAKMLGSFTTTGAGNSTQAQTRNEPHSTKAAGRPFHTRLQRVTATKVCTKTDCPEGLRPSDLPPADQGVLGEGEVVGIDELQPAKETLVSARSYFTASFCHIFQSSPSARGSSCGGVA